MLIVDVFKEEDLVRVGSCIYLFIKVNCMFIFVRFELGIAEMMSEFFFEYGRIM